MHSDWRLKLVWDAVSREPHLSIRELEAQLGMASRTVQKYLRILQEAGYISSVPKLSRARRVDVPFFWVKR